MTRITIFLKDEERTALLALAESEYRDPQGQAALIIRSELERRGLVDSAKPITQTPAQGVGSRQRVDSIPRDLSPRDVETRSMSRTRKTTRGG